MRWNHHKWLVSEDLSVEEPEHYLRVPCQGRHTIDRLAERGVERGSARRLSLKGREMAITSRKLKTNKHTNSIKGYVGETSERRGGAYMNFLEGIDTISK